MPDQEPNQDSVKRTLSEIGHLFLSEVRDRQTGGAPRPVRVPPGQRPPAAPADAPQKYVDEEPEGPNSGLIMSGEPADPERAPAPPVTAVLAAHLGGGQWIRVRQYARHLAERRGRVGLIEIDASTIRISCFEPPCDEAAEGLCFDDAPQSEVNDPRDLAEAIEELDWDVAQWLIAPISLRQPEVRPLLGDISHWTLLSTCDHDGVVSSYRTIKGLCEIVRDRKPLLTLSLLDADGQPETARVFAKLSGVSQQFLDWPMELEAGVEPAPDVTESVVLVFGCADPATEGSGPWSVLSDLIARANSVEPESIAPDNGLRIVPAADSTPAKAPLAAIPAVAPVRDKDNRDTSKPGRIAPAPTFTPVAKPSGEPAQFESSVPAVNPRAVSLPAVSLSNPSNPSNPPAVSRPSNGAVSASEEHAMNDRPRPVSQPVPDAGNRESTPVRLTAEAAVPAQTDPAPTRPATSRISEVLEISSDATAESILAAILSRPESGLVECPVRTPMCPSARLTIDRDRRVILLAVAREGLTELRSIGQAYRWLIENRALIGMAIPQLAIDALQFPRLRLLVDPADASADALQPMLQSGHVTVQPYRRIRWGNRTGLLLDAA